LPHITRTITLAIHINMYPCVCSLPMLFSFFIVPLISRSVSPAIMIKRYQVSIPLPSYRSSFQLPS
jgi:hypothetical protein